MLDSLRARLLLWYALILVLIVLAFATAVCFLFWRSLVEEVDRDLRSAAGVIAGGLRPAASGDFDLELPRQYRESEFVDHAPRTYYAVLNRRGELIDRSDPDVQMSEVARPGARTHDGRREVAVSAVNGATVLVGRDLSEARQRVLALAGTVAAAGGVVLLLSLAGGWFLAGRALAPVSRISRAATAMSRGDLSARIPIERTENELEQLASALNDAFDRLRHAADVQRRFTTDASHELRTPLAILAAELDWALSRERGAGDYRQAIETCRRASDRMRRTVDDLLTLARCDERAPVLRREPVELGSVVRDAIALLRPLAEHRAITVQTDLGTARVLGDPTQLAELVSNLLTNALEYNHEGGGVNIALRAHDHDAQLRVADTGVGIAREDLPHIFDRFYRADKARSGHGAGLGLAISKRIVEAHGGDIACQSVLGQGTNVLVRLPLGT